MMPKMTPKGQAETPTADELAALERVLGHTFTQRQLLLDALTHRSYAYEFAAPEVVSNERLEFLGDAVVALVSADLLFAHFPQSDEGALTQYRAALVRASTLARFAESVALGSLLRLGKGEETTGGRARPILLASAFEAVLGALYLDGGLAAVRAFVEPLLRAEMARIHEAGGRQIKDAKSLLQELAQAALGLTPRYQVAEETGPSHERVFTVEALLGEVVVARGQGRSKRLAEQDAARVALADPGWRAAAEASLAPMPTGTATGENA